ncbi:MAG TPA: phosphotransferase [Glycomyces sp.]|nr:phosphotransferase [Glycomyces sp.]
MDTAQVARKLGLGELRGPVEVLKPDEHSPVWKVTADSGVWALKVTKPHGDYWRAVAAQSGKLELAAWKAGIGVPEPLHTELGEAGLWRPVGEDRYARAMRFIEGEHPALPLAPPLAAWAGAAVAALEKLAIPADPSVDADLAVIPEAEWDEWFGQALDLGVLDMAQAKAFKDAAMRINPMAEESLAKRPEKLVMHRDITAVNIMLTAEGPMLLDFDWAGPQVPWWEITTVALSLAGPDLGVMRPERRVFEACMTGYAESGGRIGATDESAFTGILFGRLGSAAWELWMACGHRGGSAEMHAQFTRSVRASIGALTDMIEATPTWATWLRG